MSRCFVGIALMVSLSLMVSAGCDRGAKRISPPAVSGAAAGRAAMEEYDGDQDGKLNAAELEKCAALKSVAKKLDPKGEGVTAKMIEDAIVASQNNRIGRITYSCVVLHNDKPLEKATVKFVPEKFLGASFPGAVGTTNAAGGAGMSIPDAKPDGVAIGFYRVEITKDGENIPAKYNTESTLGVGILKPQGNSEGPAFHLKY
jgi:hypothetical protein